MAALAALTTLPNELKYLICSFLSHVVPSNGAPFSFMPGKPTHLLHVPDDVFKKNSNNLKKISSKAQYIYKKWGCINKPREITVNYLDNLNIERGSHYKIIKKINTIAGINIPEKKLKPWVWFDCKVSSKITPSWCSLDINPVLEELLCCSSSSLWADLISCSRPSYDEAVPWWLISNNNYINNILYSIYIP